MKPARRLHVRIHNCSPAVPLLCLINPTNANHPASWISLLMLSSLPSLGLPNCLSVFPVKTLYATLLAHLRVTCPAHLILLKLITRIILLKSAGHKAPRYLVFCTPLLLAPLGTNIYLSTLFSKALSLFLPKCEREKERERDLFSQTYK
jgi:hypothetical protein